MMTDIVKQYATPCCSYAQSLLGLLDRQDVPTAGHHTLSPRVIASNWYHEPLLAAPSHRKYAGGLSEYHCPLQQDCTLRNEVSGNRSSDTLRYGRRTALHRSADHVPITPAASRLAAENATLRI